MGGSGWSPPRSGVADKAFGGAIRHADGLGCGAVTKVTREADVPQLCTVVPSYNTLVPVYVVSVTRRAVSARKTVGRESLAKPDIAPEDGSSPPELHRCGFGLGVKAPNGAGPTLAMSAQQEHISSQRRRPAKHPPTKVAEWLPEPNRNPPTKWQGITILLLVAVSSIPWTEISLTFRR